MRAVSLLYHDAVESAAQLDASGFPGGGAAPYKLDIEDLRHHFRALAASGSRKPYLVTELLAPEGTPPPAPLLITFDDGGVSAATVIADMLDELGWKAHFFITTDYIGTSGFVEQDQIRALRQAGHVIGTHSASHPTRMASCDRATLLTEWNSSRARLEDILQESVAAASVPGGYYSRMVGETAAEAGIRALFTSEPIKRVSRVGSCLVLGRYNLWRGMAPDVSAQLGAAGLSAAQIKQYVFWNAKKLVKTLGGTRYLAWRRMMLDKSGRTS
jgi:peptidoglycan/xylan/chitin deacetylase (PgdA/CDA1 family)